ncbi:ABC transporter ATP-binding protein [Salinisphaera sp. LB1]|uniref:ABC transporter ATP-binding protein n=1 Tax=Salinisphaera sp. LB1 TaxID=2183911 RepID=UPI000D706767|nr:ABC transporter ATP-binding protein [Salinisphaera sp. LB1]AWN17233.1 Branched-chain amino acid transport ATP-binding protein LivG [Salinisphaera sp. LB1]
MSAILEVSGLSKRFGGVQAVNGVDFEIAEGEIFGLIGPNGAGKTTLFNLINGVIPPDTGEVVFKGETITGMAPYNVVRKGLARTHQIVKPLNDMTVLDNVTVGACFGAEHLPLKAAAKAARESIETVGLADRAEMLAGHLNIASKKRLEIARALAGRPQLLLLDETLAGLNPTEVEHMIGVIRRIREERGISILMIEHLMQVIMQLSDRIMVLNFGEKLAEGQPEEIAHDKIVIEAYLGDADLANRLMEES